MPDIVEGGLIWVCQDCLFADANGEVTGEPDCEPWALWPGGDGEPTLAMGGACDWETCEERNVHCECECDQITFSWSPCEGCGSHLGGDRHAYSYFWVTDNATRYDTAEEH